jgi:hypothetical protein
MKFLSILTVTFILWLNLSGCSGVNVDEYSNNTPKLITKEFFNGSLTAHGVVKNRSGKVIRYFNATINADWKNNIGTLEEKFIFNDGEIQYRTWVLVPNINDTTLFSATAGDVVGTGKGRVSGNAFNLNYVLKVKYNDSTINVRVNDWMWLVNEKTLLNESSLSKFGFNVGSVQLVIVKH